MKFFISTLFCLSTLFSIAQDQNFSPQVEKHQFKINLLLAPSLDYEVGLSKTITAALQVGTLPGFYVNDVTDETRFTFLLGTKLSFRHYYNFERRLRKYKNTTHNSGNFIGISSTFASSDPLIFNTDLEGNNDYYSEVGAIYGLQRTFYDKLNLSAETGLGFYFTDVQDPQFTFLLNITLGWILF
ncbi:DUF3575 domain-containing protein [Psychroflexus montanilacus]|uniref:DUF3575 domain-containing protein n=1 Tax=Psychroflexus montanilacus TaxID=2873598 RepID=UPI001CCF4405|nr:DUF3575 domain-containing protein [Psychroflexus montanilacus]MBZ9652672.1 DUF3575 domain-containing protein [Psychroflexus montanilacus]